MAPSPELTAGARAMREKRGKYFVVNTSKEQNYVDHSAVSLHYKGKAEKHIVFEGTYRACLHWIDCQAFAAGLQAMLPVSDEIGRLVGRHFYGRDAAVDEDDVTDGIQIITAAIHHITSGSAKE